MEGYSKEGSLLGYSNYKSHDEEITKIKDDVEKEYFDPEIAIKEEWNKDEDFQNTESKRSQISEKSFENWSDFGKEEYKPYKCTKCNQAFEFNKDLLLPIQMTHKNKKSFECSKCNHSFYQEGEFFIPPHHLNKFLIQERLISHHNLNLPQNPLNFLKEEKDLIVDQVEKRLKFWPKLDCQFMALQHRIQQTDSQYEIEVNRENQILINNGSKFPGFAIGMGHTNPKYHNVSIDATKAKKSQKRPTPFEIFAKDVKVKYMTLQMPENHNSIVFGAVTRVPQDLILNIKFNMISSDEFSGSEHIGLKEAAREMKIFIVPLTESYLKKAESVSELEIGIELVKRRWQENIQIISVIRENKKIKRSKRLASPVTDWSVLEDTVVRKRKMVDININDLDSEAVKYAKLALQKALKLEGDL